MQQVVVVVVDVMVVVVVAVAVVCCRYLERTLSLFFSWAGLDDSHTVVS